MKKILLALLLSSALFLVSCRSTDEVAEEVEETIEEVEEPQTIIINWQVIIRETHDNFGNIIDPWYTISLVADGAVGYNFRNNFFGTLIAEPSEDWFEEGSLITLSSRARNLHEDSFAVLRTSETELVLRHYGLFGTSDVHIWDAHTIEIEQNSIIETEEPEIIFAEPTIIHLPFNLEKATEFMLEHYTSIFFVHNDFEVWLALMEDIYRDFENGSIEILPNGMREDGFVARGYSVANLAEERAYVILFWENVLKREDPTASFFAESFEYIDGQFVKMEQFIFEGEPWGGAPFINWVRSDRLNELISNHSNVIMWSERI
ncbi:MAG: hypothetical protein FWD82_03890 [Defluviitaleaceae bacterium]|nr:hypothetical protein [Defluviitaleaceae bacterium]